MLESQVPGCSPVSNEVRRVSSPSWLTPESIDSSESIVDVELPEFLNSVESLRFCGLNEKGFQRVFKRYQDGHEVPGPFNTSLIHFATAAIRHSPIEDAWPQSDDWVSTFNLSEDTTLTGGPSQPPIVAIESELPSSVQPLHKIFFKGGSMQSLKGFIMKDGALNFRHPSILSSPPGDFSETTLGLYLTTQHKAAWEYAHWKAKVVDGKVVPVEIMTLAVPQELLASKVEVYGDVWRDFVWSNRKPGIMLDDRFDYISGSTWCVGPLCAHSQDIFDSLKDKSEIEVWKLERGECASQWFTSSRAMLQLLSEACRNKIWLKQLINPESSDWVNYYDIHTEIQRDKAR